jgi:Na+-translocating ferredoxin:NAD+ oxidoreductase RNF subunit RnfB
MQYPFGQIPAAGCDAHPAATICFQLFAFGRSVPMTYVIAEPCIGTKDTACVDACPVDCIHPKKDEAKYG